MKHMTLEELQKRLIDLLDTETCKKLRLLAKKDIIDFIESDCNIDRLIVLIAYTHPLPYLDR